MASKKEIFEQTLTSAYNPQKYVDFIREMITGVKIIAPDEAQNPYNTFSVFVANYFHVGEYEDKDGEKVGIFAVELNRGESIERARTAQRSFVKTLLEKGGYAGALVAFYSAGANATTDSIWRLSFIRMDYEFAKGKIKETLTPAKRYSYLVGKGEPCHTAMDRLYPIFVDDNLPPTLDELEEAFSVESVTKEFFEKYKEKYLEMHDFLMKNEDFVRESEIRGFTAEQFTKKLLSQIVFLYFVQKKGWLGVTAIPPVMMEREYKNAFFAKGSKSRELVGKVYVKNDRGTYDRNPAAIRNLSTEDEEILSTIVKGRPWGTGPKNFMRSIFNDCVKRGGNFFDDYLEPLFYTGLNKNRGENAFFPPLHCRIPFLNGGLFEELDNYDWENNDFQIPNEMFSNVDTKGRDADGVLDIFDRYNFTMAEDEPMEREVAVDPEMLGKVFENLLEVKDRKSKGAFYTPREIVHYMCQESLINYLVTKSGISEEDIRKLVLYGEYFKDKDAEKTKKVANKNGNGFHMELDKEKEFEIPSSIFNYKGGVNRIKEIDDYLASVKVVDPAVGSGAFPLGMLNEIVKTRDTLSTYITLEMNPFEKKAAYAPGFVGSRSSYDLKAETIKNCIFACDIEPSATDISKLRLWLSLVIDDELTAEGLDGGTFGEHSKPKQLPNLDCNIICGNSLVDSFEGIDFINKSDVLKNITGEHQENLLQPGVDTMITTLISLQDKLFYTKEPFEKLEIKKQIQNIYDAIIEEQLKSNPELLQKYIESHREHSRPFVIWQLFFPQVFKDNGGFDICIGNPPYGAKLDDFYKQLFKEKYANVHMRTPDTYIYFISLGCSLLNEGGNISYIVPNNLLYQNENKSARELLSNDQALINVINIGDNVFENATVPTCIFISEKKHADEYTFNYVDFRKVPAKEITWGEYTECIDINDLRTTPGMVIGVNSKNRRLLEKIANNSALIDNIVDEMASGISTGGNKAFCPTAEDVEEYQIENGVIFPMIAGKEIDSYEINPEKRYVIYLHKNADIKTCPNAISFIEAYREKLEKRSEVKKGVLPWWAMNRPRYAGLFEGKKIIMRQTSDTIRAVIDDNNLYAIDSLLVLRLKSDCVYSYEYILAALNADFNDYVYKNITQESGRVFPQVKPINVRKLYVPKMSEEGQTEITNIVADILNGKIARNEGEEIINNMFNSFFGFSNEELDAIKTANNIGGTQ